MKTYKVLLHPATYSKASTYLEELKTQKEESGFYLYKKLNGISLKNLSVEVFLEKLFQTKKPQIFAESTVSGNGSDWNQKELSILGDIGFAVPVTIFDNGRHQYPKLHLDPFEGMLLFTPGALLRSNGKSKPADWAEVVDEGARNINFDGFYKLYERRLLPLLLYANSIVEAKGKKALITIPGLGCGQFAGIFKGTLGDQLKKVLIKILEMHGEKLGNISAIYYDPYQECTNETFVINNISLLVRPLVQGNENKSQLSSPVTFNENGVDFSDCFLFSFVAWDHVSWPGNDFYVGSRATDDGVKAAATSSMQSITGIKGEYSTEKFAYYPPSKFHSWNGVVLNQKVELEVTENLLILPSL